MNPPPGKSFSGNLRHSPEHQPFGPPYRRAGKCSRLAEVLLSSQTSPVLPLRTSSQVRKLLPPTLRGRWPVPVATALIALLLPIGCHRNRFPDVPDGYREFAYVTN